MAQVKEKKNTFNKMTASPCSHQDCVTPSLEAKLRKQPLTQMECWLPSYVALGRLLNNSEPVPPAP